MIECDLHVHSIRSSCGYHTLLELVDIVGGNEGLKGFALTDHGPIHDTPRPHFSVMLRRMPSIIGGLRVFKGIESTILSEDGRIDLPAFPFDSSFEIVLAGLHNYGEFEYSPDRKKNTRAIVNTLENNPAVRVITHPFYKDFPLDPDAVTDAACRMNAAIEVNNSYLLTGKSDLDTLDSLLEHAREKKTMLCVNSDGHMFNEIARFDLAIDVIERHGGIDAFFVVNRTLESTLSFLGLDT